MRWCVLSVVLGGCFSWSQADPPARTDWATPGHECDASSSAARGAGTVAVLSGGVATAIFLTTDGGGASEGEEGGLLGEDFGERMVGGMLVFVAIGYALDAINAASDASRCRKYEAYQARRVAPPPAP